MAGCALSRLRRRIAPSRLPVAAAPEAPPAPKAQFGTYGFDTAGMDSSRPPRRRFLQFANGTWAKNTLIPADKSNYGAFTALQDISQQRVRDILDAAKNDPGSRDRRWLIRASSTRRRSKRGA